MYAATQGVKDEIIYGLYYLYFQRRWWWSNGVTPDQTDYSYDCDIQLGILSHISPGDMWELASHLCGVQVS